MKKIYITLGIIVITAILVLVFNQYLHEKNENGQIKSSQINYSQIKIKDKKIKVEIADNLELRMKGLSGRGSLCQNCGMLFVFEKPDIYPFWMKEMNFPLDIIWIKNLSIVEIVKSASTPEAAGQVMNYTPNAPADLVLELNAGFCEKHDLKIGDGIEIKK